MQLTWEKLARRIAAMTPEQRRKPVYITTMPDLLYAAILEEFETDMAVCAEIAHGDPILKTVN